MPRSTPSLRVFLFASILAGRIQLATAACSNFTVLVNGVESHIGYGTAYKQKIDSISCPSSLNHSCQLLQREYTITVPTQLNVSLSKNFPGPGERSASNIDRQQENSYAFDTSTYSSDVESIFRLVGDYWASRGMEQAAGHWTVQTPLTIAVSTLNITQAPRNTTEESLDFVDLTVRSGYSLTLYYIPFMTFLWSRFSGCDNGTLDGFPINTVMPHFTQQYIGESAFTVLAGKFLAEETLLDDSAVVDKKSLGLSLKSWAGWSIVSISLSCGFVLL